MKKWLELLTKELVAKEMFVKDTKIKVISNAIDVKPKEEKCNWETRLFTLLAALLCAASISAGPRLSGSGTKAARSASAWRNLAS